MRERENESEIEWVREAERLCVCAREREEGREDELGCGRKDGIFFFL